MKEILKKLKNHLRYDAWLYVGAIFILCVAFSMLYSITEPEVDADKRVHILVASQVSGDVSDSWSEGILSVLPEDQEEVEFLVLNITEGDYEDGEVLQAFYARLLTNEGDLMILPYWLYKICGERGFFVPLSDTRQDGSTWLELLDLPDNVDPERDRINLVLETDESDNPTSTRSVICGIPLDEMSGLWEINVNPSDMVACIPYYSQNQDNALKALQWLIDHTYPS